MPLEQDIRYPQRVLAIGGSRHGEMLYVTSALTNVHVPESPLVWGSIFDRISPSVTVTVETYRVEIVRRRGYRTMVAFETSQSQPVA